MPLDKTQGEHHGCKQVIHWERINPRQQYTLKINCLERSFIDYFRVFMEIKLTISQQHALAPKETEFPGLHQKALPGGVR